MARPKKSGVKSKPRPRRFGGIAGRSRLEREFLEMCGGEMEDSDDLGEESEDALRFPANLKAMSVAEISELPRVLDPSAKLELPEITHEDPEYLWTLLARDSIAKRRIIRNLSRNRNGSEALGKIDFDDLGGTHSLLAVIRLANNMEDVEKGNLLADRIVDEIRAQLEGHLKGLDNRLRKIEAENPQVPRLSLIEQDLVGLVRGAQESWGVMELPRIGDRTSSEVEDLRRALRDLHPKKLVDEVLDPRGRLFSEGILDVNLKDLVSNDWERVDLLPGGRDAGSRQEAGFGDSYEPKTSLAEVILPESTRADLRALCAEYKRRVQAGRPIKMAFYFEGPPGTGKTITAEAIAKELGLKVLRLAVGQGRSDTLHTLVGFYSARSKSGNALMLFDEADSMLSANRFTGASDSWAKMAFEHFEGVAIFTSNHAISRAMERRMTYTVKFKNPGSEARAIVYAQEIRRACEEAGITEQPSSEEIKKLADRFSLSGGFVSSSLLLAVAHSEPGTLKLAAIEKAFAQREQELGDDRGDSPRKPKVRLEDVKLTPRNRREIDQFIRYAERLADKPEGLPPGATILFSGPPGTGKTITAEAIASALQKPFKRISPSSLLSKYVGETEQKIREVFDEASEEGQVLMIDEAEGLFADRAGAHRSWEVTQANELLQQVESFKGVLIIATNHSERMDPASARRFIFKLRFDPPGLETRRELWNLWRERLGVEEGVILKLASSFELTGGEIRNVCAKALAREAVSFEELAESCEQEIAIRTGREIRKMGI